MHIYVYTPGKDTVTMHHTNVRETEKKSKNEFPRTRCSSWPEAWKFKVVDSMLTLNSDVRSAKYV